MKVERELIRGAGPVAVLQLLKRHEMYGYELAETLSRKTSGVLAMGQSTLYPLLYSLEAKQLVESRWVETELGPQAPVLPAHRQGRGAPRPAARRMARAVRGDDGHRRRVAGNARSVSMSKDKQSLVGRLRPAWGRARGPRRGIAGATRRRTSRRSSPRSGLRRGPPGRSLPRAGGAFPGWARGRPQSGAAARRGRRATGPPRGSSRTTNGW